MIEYLECFDLDLSIDFVDFGDFVDFAIDRA